MRIYADTSFLVSLLYRGDSAHGAARKAFAQYSAEDWLSSEWSQFETVNSLRQLCLGGLDAPRAEALVRLFKHLHQYGPFDLVETGWEEAHRDCRQLSAAHATRMKMRSADVLHVALLDQINPGLFVTRDRDQFTLAQSRGFQCMLL